MAAGTLVFLGSSAAPGPVHLSLLSGNILHLVSAHHTLGFLLASPPSLVFSPALRSWSPTLSAPSFTPSASPLPFQPIRNLLQALSTHFSLSSCTSLVFYQLLTDRLISSTWWFSELSKQHGLTSQAYVFFSTQHKKPSPKTKSFPVLSIYASSATSEFPVVQVVFHSLLRILFTKKYLDSVF